MIDILYYVLLSVIGFLGLFLTFFKEGLLIKLGAFLVSIALFWKITHLHYAHPVSLLILLLGVLCIYAHMIGVTNPHKVIFKVPNIIKRGKK